MNWNNGSNKRNLKKELASIRKIFESENLPIELYEEYEKLLLSQYKSDRCYAEHTQEFLLSKFEEDLEDESESALYEKFEVQLTTTIEDSIHKSRYWWVEEIDDYELAHKIKQLSTDDLELITLYVFDGYNESEIADRQGCKKQNIQQKIQRIKNFLK